MISFTKITETFNAKGIIWTFLVLSVSVCEIDVYYHSTSICFYGIHQNVTGAELILELSFNFIRTRLIFLDIAVVLQTNKL